ncbi:MAG: alpha/beta fold hydrolase [Christensenellales bacterium]
MEEKIPDAGLVVQEGAGHFAYLEHNQAFLRIAKNFLLEGRA